MSIISENSSKNFININNKKNKDFLICLKLLELRLYFIQTLIQIQIIREIQDRHFNIQFKNFSLNLLTFVALIVQIVKSKKFYKLKIYAKIIIDNYRKIN